MPKVVIEVTDGFSAWGRDFLIGEQLSDQDYASWPEGTVENRLKAGFLKHKVVPDTPVPKVDLTELEALLGEELVEFAKAKLDLVISSDLSDEEKIAQIRLAVKG